MSKESTRVVQSRYEQFSKLADKIRLEYVEVLETEYWNSHKEIGEKSYTNPWEQSKDMQELGQLAEAIALLKKGQGKLRCINGVNTVT